MQPSYWALALFAALGVSSPVSPNLPLEARDSSDPSLANLDYVQYHFASTNIDVTLWTIRDVQGTGFGPYFSSKDPTVWFGSNYKSVCLLFCADPGADARIRSEKCRGTCKEPALLPGNAYITSTNLAIQGDQLIYCPNQAQGVICNAAPPYATANYGG